jgi:hypothetical protein
LHPPPIQTSGLALARSPGQPPNTKSLDEITEEVFATLATDQEGEADSNILTFQRHEGGLVMRAATVRAHLKDCARVLSGFTGRLERERSFATRFINAVYPDPVQYWLPILRPDGSPVTKHDGAHRRSRTPRAPALAL